MKSLQEILFDKDLANKDLSEHDITLSIIKNYLDSLKTKYNIKDNSIDDTYIKIEFDKPQIPVKIHSWSLDIHNRLLKKKLPCISVGNDSKNIIVRFYWSLDESLNEGLFDTDLAKRKTTPEKLAYVLKKFFGNDVALCTDHQGSRVWYEINPLTITIKDMKNLWVRIIKYCEKIDGLEIKMDKFLSFTSVKGYIIGDDTYWIYLDNVKYSSRRVRVSKDFYECGVLPQDQTGVARRGWDEW